MISVINILKEKEGFISLKSGASSTDIQCAEEQLGVKFAADYYEYTSVFGAASYNSHELSGVCKAKLYDVVAVTLADRELYEVYDNMYVIEDTHIDGIVFWQASDGKIYKTMGKTEPIKVFDSLFEYINQQ